MNSPIPNFPKFFKALLVLVGLGLCLEMAAQPLPRSRPEQQGVSSERLKVMHQLIRGHVDEGNYAGAVWLVARRGRLVDWGSYGSQDLETKTPMAQDSICRIYSMSKIITSVAVMMLYEEGKIGLEDPIGKYIPGLSNPMVLTGGTVEVPILEPATNAITIQHLLTHTSGLAYGFLGEGVLHQIYNNADLWNSVSLEAFVDKAARLPLQSQPGSAFVYGINTDVLGYLVQVVSGMPFEIFLKDRIFDPLTMVDTGFHVPMNNRIRLAKMYEHREDGNLSRASVILGAYEEEGVGFPSGGVGLFSTISDYARFSQMLLNGGRLSKVRLLGRKTVTMMQHNYLAGLGDGTHQFSQAYGFGLGVEVRTHLTRGGTPGSMGQFGWSGAATTHVNIDPHEETLALLFIQHLPFDEHKIFPKFKTTWYQSLIDSPSPGAAAPRY